jgi:general secretion pathway protein K
VRRGERGVAVITALLIVAVAAAAASLMLAQQSAMIDQAMLVASRAQADQYAQAGLDWARGVLVEDLRSGAAVDSLDEGWAKPITALPIERAVVSGAIVDEQGKFNLNNLVSGTSKSAPDMEAFARLLASLGLAPELSEAVLDWIDADQDIAGPAGAEDAYYLSLKKPYRAANRPMIQVDELYRVRGFDAAAVAKLRPYVTALPARTRVNVNTAGEAVLAALLPKVPRMKIAQLVAARGSKPLRTMQEVVQWASEAPAAEVMRDLDVRTGYFGVRVQVAQDDVELANDALVRRGDDATTAIVWRRPRY